MKKALSLITILAVSISLLFGCKKKTDDEIFLHDGKEVILKIGDNNYISADDLFDEYINKNVNFEKIYEKLREVIIRESVKIDNTLKNNINAKYRNWEKELESSLSKNETLKQKKEKSLLEKGFANEDEMLRSWYLELQEEKLTNNFWKSNENKYYENYQLTNLPFHLSIIKIDLSKETILNSVSKKITEENAKQISRATLALMSGLDFSQVAQTFSNDDSKSNGGDIGLVSLTSDIDDNVKLALLSYVKYVQNAQLEWFDDSFVDDFYYDGIEAIGDKYVKIMLDKAATTSEKMVSSYPSNIPSTQIYYRNGIFNNLFNSDTFRYLYVDNEDNILNDNALTLMDVKVENIEGTGFIETKEKKVVINNQNHPILLVRGSDGLYFISINKSPFDENAVNYFKYDEADKTSRNYVNNSYDELMREERINQLKSFAKEYVNMGVYGSSDQKYNDFAMIKEAYLTSGVEIVNKQIKDKFEKYLDQQTAYLKENFENSLKKIRDKLNSYVSYKNSSYLEREIIPLACSENRTNCKYTYKKGYVYEKD